jgi:hypothetical protein
MKRMIHLIKKGWAILRFRIQTQGLWTTLNWLYGRGVPAITGVPILRYSRVSSNLYVGPQFRMNGKQFLEKEGIRGCVNMRIERDDSAYGLALPHYLYLPTIDDDAPSIEHLDLGVSFIREVIQSGEKVYIHCGAGVGRAPTMAAAYLIAEGCSLDEALGKIKKVRPFITITPVQMAQLKQYELRLQSRND